jgi:ATP-dependent DNA helicase RecQ
LIALQRDQVEAISEHDLGGAAEVNSIRAEGEREEAFDELEDGEIEFIFLAPEQFANEETMERLRAARPSLFVVDEAHCISEWGHDFRPEYLRLGAVIEELGVPRTLVLTATAAPPVRQEIVDRLGMRDPRIVVRGFDRPNLRLLVERFGEDGADEKRAALLERVVAAEKPGIVYAATRRGAEELAAELAERGVKALPYHAGLPDRERERAQDAFMDDAIEVIVATTAFGMGIDKPNVRFVFHLDVSESVDAYYQEIGRAGRDGLPAEATLFFREEDMGLRRFFAGSGRLDEAQIEAVAEAVHERGKPAAISSIAAEVGLSAAKASTALSRLAEVGGIEVLPLGEVVSADGEDVEEAAAEAADAQENMRRFDRSRVEMMRGYADTRGCRREYLLNYFEEAFEPPCGRCTNCEAGLVGPKQEDRPFALESRVVHRVWGEGLVMRYESDKVVVLFDSVGYRTLGLDIVRDEGLLAPTG